MSGAEAIARAAERRGIFEEAEKVLDAVIGERDTLKSENDLLRSRITTVEAEGRVLQAEINRLQELLKEEGTRVRMLQAFGTAITTQMDIIGDVIAKAKRDAQEQATRLGISVQSQQTPEEKSDSDRAAEIISRVPPG